MKWIILAGFLVIGSPAHASTLDLIAGYVQSTATTNTEYVDLVREFVYTNSEPGVAPYAWNTETVLEMLWAHHQGSGPRPKVTCGPAALAAQAIYDRLGIYNRLVAIYTDVGTNLLSHTYNEVVNHDTGQWEVHDAYFGTYYMMSDRRLSTTELLTVDSVLIVPTSPRGTGWVENGVDHLRDVYFELAVIHSRFTGQQWHNLIVNPARFDLDKVYPERGESFRQYAAVRYLGSPIYVLQVP